MDAAKKIGRIYVRVSGGEQAETGNSIENQKAQCLEYAARSNIIVSEIYVDAGISGRSTKRPEFLRMQKDCQAGEHIIAFCISRISRSVKNFISIIEWAEQNSITLHTVREAIDTKSAQGSFLTVLYCALSQLEANMTQERMAELNTRKLRRGETTKAPPFGYRSVKYQIGVPARLIPDPIEQGAISRMFALRCDTNFHQTPFRKIAEILTSEGHRPRRSEQFTVESIRQIMKREYEFRMRVHDRLDIPEYIIQRYADLCMPFIVPINRMDEFIVEKDGRRTYNGMYEDTSITQEKVNFFSGKTERRKKRNEMLISSSLDLQLLMYDREKELEKQIALLVENQISCLRALYEEEYKAYRKIIEKNISSRMKLDENFSVIRSQLQNELRLAKLRYELHVGEKMKQNPNYVEVKDLEALKLLVVLTDIEKRLEGYEKQVLKLPETHAH